MENKFKTDSIVNSVISKFKQRAEIGVRKYNTDLDRKDLNTSEWLQHLQEELHDAYLYSEKLKQEEEKRNKLLDLLMNYMERGKFDDGERLEFKQLNQWYFEQQKFNDSSRL